MRPLPFISHKVVLTLFPKLIFYFNSVSIAISLMSTVMFISPGFLASIFLYFIFKPVVICLFGFTVLLFYFCCHVHIFVH